MVSTAEELAAIKALCDAATPGPWEEDTLMSRENGRAYRQSAVIAEGEDVRICDTLNASHHFTEEERKANATFIAAARTAVPALLAEVERLRADLETTRMQLVACGVVALANTPDSVATMRETIATAYRTDSLRCVEAAVDREIAMRADAAALREALKQIASCEVRFPGDVVSIARAALARTGGGA